MTTTSSDGAVKRVLHRLGSSDEQLEAEELKQTSAESGAQSISQCTEGSVVTVSGPLRSVTLKPISGLPSVEAEIYDGSGRIRLIWMGRRRIAAIDPGRVITVTGRLTINEGQCTIFNPRYVLSPILSDD